MRTRSGGILATQQEIKKYTESIDIGGRGDGAGHYLFRCGETRGQSFVALERKPCGSGGIVAIGQKLRNTKIQQFDVAFVCDQNVCRFDIAVNDEIAVRMTHRAQHVEEQLDPTVYVE